MRSRREALIRAVVSRCQAALDPVPVVRQPTTALPRARTPALLLTVLSDTPARRSNDRMERELVLQLTGHARDPTDGYAVADDLLCRAHAALFADSTLGGLALAITEQEADYLADDADVEAIALPATYRFTYRTLVSDIAQGG